MRADVAPNSLRLVISAGEKLIKSPFSLILERRSGELYAAYVAATAHIIRASTDIMRVAAEAASLEATGGKLVDYLQHHIGEEEHHYEWILEDLASLKVDVNRYLAETSTASVLAIPGIAYYCVRNISPWSVLGYIAVLEATPPEEKVLNTISATLGLAEQASRTLRLHGELDYGHADELFGFIEREACSHGACIRHSAVLTLSSYAVGMGSVLNAPRQ